MQKEFKYISDSSLADVIAVALGDDEGSSSVSYRFLSEEKRLWLVRKLHNDESFRYLECFEFCQNEESGWGFRAWSEEDTIPFLDCPLDLLSQTNGAIKRKWRMAVLAFHAAYKPIPRGVWIHSVSGVRLPGDKTCFDFCHIGAGHFKTPEGEVYRLKPQAIARIMQEGFGIASGRA
jgi:hypothetical protein